MTQCISIWLNIPLYDTIYLYMAHISIWHNLSLHGISIWHNIPLHVTIYLYMTHSISTWHMTQYIYMIQYTSIWHNLSLHDTIYLYMTQPMSVMQYISIWHDVSLIIGRNVSLFLPCWQVNLGWSSRRALQLKHSIDVHRHSTEHMFLET